MKNTKQRFSLMIVAVLIFSLLNIPALAADSVVADIIAAPVQYSLSVDGESVSLWAYVIDGGVFFKLRDIAMALNGTKKQFEVYWQADDDYKEVDLSSGMAYTPVGGELSAPSNKGNAAIQPATATFYSDAGRAAILAYTVDDAHYVKLSDLAATLKFASTCDEEKRTAEINTSPKFAPAEETGEAFDNIAMTHAGNSYFLDKDGNVILSYLNGATTVKVPLTLNTSDLHSPGMEEHDTGFYISGAKTAIAYGGDDAPIQVLISDDMGKTWNTYTVESSKYMRTNKYIGFITENDGWLVASPGVAMGSSDNYIFKTHDGGKTWTQIGNPNDMYSSVLTGAGFANENIGFLSFRFEFADFSPAICWTQDGGYTWEKLYVTLPAEFDQYNKTPLSPVFNGAKGLYPILLSNSGEDAGTLYLTSDDYGKTWMYDRSVKTTAFDTGIYSFLIPENWKTEMVDSAYYLNFTSSGETIGSFIIHN